MSVPIDSMKSQPRDTLVAVVTSNADLAFFRDEGWYRLPDRVLGRLLNRSVLEEITTLALYQTGAVTDGMPSGIELWGEVTRIDSIYRRELFPTEADHPAANQLYHKICVERVEYLEQPILSRHSRRVAFIRTIRERLLRATDLSDLIIGSRAEEELMKELQARNLDVDRKIYMQVRDTVMEVDFGLFAEGHQIGLLCSEDGSEETNLVQEVSTAWNLLRFSPSRIENHLEECLREIMDLVEKVRTSIGVRK